MATKFSKLAWPTLLGFVFAFGTNAALADSKLTADRAQRLFFAPLNTENLSVLKPGDSLEFRIDGMNLQAKLLHGVDITGCKISFINRDAEAIAAAEITDVENGLVKVTAGSSTGTAKLFLKCRNKQINTRVRVE